MKDFSQNNYKAEFKLSEKPRIGLIALSTDFTIEQDFRNVFYKQPVNLFVNRIPFENPMKMMILDMLVFMEFFHYY